MHMIKHFKNRKGFTLVELLIVIAVIGILAVAVLAAIDPVEQLKKSRDTGRLADARELVSAYQRYAVGNRCYPNEQPAVGGACTVGDLVATQVNAAWVAGDFAKLNTARELKPNFTGKASVKANELWYFHTNDVMSVCFNPESRAGRTGAMGEIVNVTTAAGVTSIAAVSPVLLSNCDTTYSPAALDTSCTVCIQ